MQPREKLLRKGIDAMSDLDLVSLLVGSGINGVSYREISSEVYRVIRKKREVTKLGVGELVKLKGVGKVLATKLLAGIELGRRLHSVTNERPLISDSSTAVNFFAEIMEKKREHVKALYLNGRYQLLHNELLSIGTLSKVSVTPQDILVPALECNAAYIIIGHNHPSGNPTPSNSDILLTKRIQEACEIVGIKLLDHIIVCRGGRWCNLITESNQHNI